MATSAPGEAARWRTARRCVLAAVAGVDARRYTAGVRRFQAIGTNVGFTCGVCGTDVPPLANGSYRNHCPFCLHSLHVDVHPGDRAHPCHGVLEPIGVEHSGKKGWVIVHRCRTCGEVRRNRAALDDPACPDDYDAIVALTARR